MCKEAYLLNTGQNISPFNHEKQECITFTVEYIPHKTIKGHTF